MLLLKAFLKVFACYVLQDAELKTHTVHYFPNRYVNAFALFQVETSSLANKIKLYNFNFNFLVSFHRTLRTEPLFI